MPQDRTLLVYVDLDGRPRLAGRLHARVAGDFEDASFEPDREWAVSPEARLCAPMLALAPLPRSSGATMPLFGAIGDSAPDRWGRTLMRRAERRKAWKEKRPARVLRETDFLLGIDDEVRAGGLRFSVRKGGPFLGNREDAALPTVRGLARLLKAVQAHESARDTDAQLRLLLVSGQLLGGSRPKSSVRDVDGRLLVAKFPSKGDGRDMQRWEALALGLAADCGIRVPQSRVAAVGGQRVLLLARFDRDAATGRRIPFVSAMGLLAAQDNEASSYVSFAEVIRAVGGRPRDDLFELWKRAAFSVLISNKDNHQRNHGLLLEETGWRLAPAFDLNPEPQPLKPRQLIFSIDGVDDRASVAVLLDAAEKFGVSAGQARRTLRDMAGVIPGWRERAQRLRLPEEELRKMRGAFEHEDLTAAARA